MEFRALGNAELRALERKLLPDPGVASLISPRSHTFVEIDLEIISPAILLLLLIQNGLSVTCESTCRKYWLTT